MTERDDDQLELKKRARRRLVGAAAFATLAVVFLPMVMDETPPPAGHEVQIKIPGQEPTGVAPLAGKPVTSAAVPPNVGGATDKAAAAGSAATAMPGTDKAGPAAAGETAKTAESPKSEPSAKVVAVTRAAGAADSNKVAAKPAEKETAARESSAKDAPGKETVARETAARETAAKDAASREGDGKRAQAILDGKSQSAPHVILIGAFANTANVKGLQTKLAELGIKTYTESIDSPQGRKTRLRAGPFPSRDAAEKAQGKMKRIGVNGVVAVKP